MNRTWVRKPEKTGLHYMRVRCEVDFQPVWVQIETCPRCTGDHPKEAHVISIGILSSDGKSFRIDASPDLDGAFEDVEFLPVPDPTELETLLALGRAAREFLDHYRRAAGVVTDWVRRNHIELAQWLLAQAVFEIGEKWPASPIHQDGVQPGPAASPSTLTMTEK